MPSTTSLVLLWLGALVALVILIWLTNIVGSQEEAGSEDEAADEPVMPKYDRYWVRLDCASSLDQKIEAIRAEVGVDGNGKCHNLNTGITGEHFPGQHTSVSGKKIEIFLIPLKNKEVKEVGLFEYMDKFGLRPGRIEELIDLSQVYPEIHRKTALIAFGSVWENSDDNRLVPYFEFDGAVYGVYLGRVEDILANKSNDDCFAIAVGKER